MGRLADEPEALALLVTSIQRESTSSAAPKRSRADLSSDGPEVHPDKRVCDGQEHLEEEDEKNALACPMCEGPPFQDETDLEEHYTSHIRQLRASWSPSVSSPRRYSL